MNSKDEILKRLRRNDTDDRQSKLPSLEDKDIFIDFPDSSDNLIDMFKNQLNKLSGELYVVTNKEEIVEKLNTLLKNVAPDRCITHKFPLVDELKELSPEIRNYLVYIDEFDISSTEFANFEVGISSADCLIARTGSILLQARSTGGRRLSVLPPTHIVIAEEKQIVASLDEAFNLLNLNQEDWGYATIISGPSRTADIEKQLVLGAHGPKRLVVILLKT